MKCIERVEFMKGSKSGRFIVDLLHFFQHVVTVGCYLMSALCINHGYLHRPRGFFLLARLKHMQPLLMRRAHLKLNKHPVHVIFFILSGELATTGSGKYDDRFFGLFLRFLCFFERF